jgi:hypothetical protein
MDDQVFQALKALAERDRGVEAPPGVETRLLAAFHRRRAARRTRLAVLGIAAAAAIASVALLLPRRAAVDPPAVPAPRAVVSERPAEVTAQVAAAPAPKPVKRVARRTPAAPPRQVVREVFTEFFPLMESAPPLESGELLRVIVPASTMRTVGLPVREDRWTEPVEADILFGQEGVARAIRFVRYEQ